MTKKRSRGPRIVRWTLGIVGGLLVAAVIYGPQSGDGTPTATDAEVEAVVVAEVRDLAARLP